MREVFLGKEAAFPIQQPPRIAMYRTPFWAEMTADGAAQFLATIDFLASNGFEVEELSIPNEFASLRHTHQRLMAFEVACNHVPEYAYENHHKLGELTLQVFAEGSVSTEEYFVRRSEVTRARREFNQLSSAYDAVLGPSAPGTAPKIAATGNPIFNRLWSLLGTPAITLPSGANTQKLPFGLQLVSGTDTDRRLIEVAEQIEETLTHR